MKMMSKSQKELLTRPEVKFWLAIIGLIVSGAVAFTNLKNNVTALNAQVADHEEKYKGVVGTLKDIRESQIRIEKDIEFIYKQVGGKRDE